MKEIDALQPDNQDRGFGVPNLPNPYMGRENILDTIDQMLQGVEVAILEGPEGRGKTTTAALFVKRHQPTTINVFINPASRWAYQPMSIASEIALQIANVIGRPIINEEVVSSQEYEAIQYKMRSWLRRKNREMVFVVDGLFEIPQTDAHLATEIWGMLPFGTNGCKFLITKDSRSQIDLVAPKSSKEIILVPFGAEESIQYLTNVGVDQKTAEQLQKTCNGQPNWLASVQRLIGSGMEVQELTEGISRHLPDLFQIEWKPVSSFDSQIVLALAVIAHDQQKHKITSLGTLLSIDETKLTENLKTVSFLNIDSRDGLVSFVSEPYRRFAAEKLQKHKKHVEDVVIKDLLKRQTQQEVAAVLPTYLKEAGKLKELLQFLTPDNFERTLQHSQSLVPVKEQVSIGIEASAMLARDSELVRFAIYKSALIQLESTEFWKSEVEARIALNDFGAAYALANAAGIREDKVHLLAVIAKAKIKRAIQVEPELLESIKALCAQIDSKNLGKRALEIASDLVYSLPELAVEMVESSSSSETERSSDIAIASLALMAAKSNRLSENEEYANEIQAKIHSPEIKRFIDETSIKTDNTSAKDILRQIKRLPNAEKELFFLRRWLVQNRRRDDAYEIVEESLNIAIRAAEYTPNARDMREMATPLPYIEDKERLQSLVATFAANKANIEKYGPTIDYVRFLLFLARGEFRHESQRGKVWIEDAYLTSLAVEDLAVRAECFAWVFVSLTLADQGQTLEQSDQLHSLAETGIRETIALLLKASALQDVAFSGTISALSQTHTSFAVDIAMSLNTEPRRDEALAQTIISLLSSEIDESRLAIASEILKKIIDPDIRDDALASGVERIKRKKLKGGIDRKPLLRLLEPIKMIGDPMIRCRTLTRFYAVLADGTGTSFSRETEVIYGSIIGSLNELDNLWERIHIGFEAVALIAPSSLEHAQNLLAVAEAAKRDSLLQTDNSAGAYLGTLQLAISAYSGLFARHLADDNDLNRLGSLINNIPSDGERARIWSEIALKAHFSKRSDLCQSIVKDKVRPLIESLQRTSQYSASELISRVAAALYLAHPTSAKEDFKALSAQNRNFAYSQICRCILEKRTVFEPFEPDAEHVYDLDYDQSLIILDLVSQTYRDDTAYYHLDDLVSSLDVKGRGLTRDQSALVVSKIETFATSIFPNASFINHSGYSICVKSLVLKLKQPKAKSSDFDVLTSEASTIPNESDKIFVLCMIASAIHSRDRAKKQKLLDEAYQLALSLPCVYDRIARIRLIASEARSSNEAFSKQILESGMKIALAANNHEIWPLQRQILDFAFRIDPEYATKLVSLADTDPARIHTRLSLKHRLDVLNTTKSLSEKPKSRQREKEDKDDYPQAAWRLLGQLNAGRIAHKPQEELREFIHFASKLPFSRAYPIFAWVIGNSVSRFSNTDQAGSVIRPIFEATLLGCQISARMADQNSRALNRSFIGGETATCSVSTSLIQAGERDLALSRIRVWIEQKVTDYLIICDPFFGPADLEVLKLVLAFKPSIQVSILTSLKHQTQEKVEQPYPDTYTSHWKAKISDQDPPDTDVMLIGTQGSNDSPIHDRWWLTANSGLRLGTSFQSLGVGKVSELSELTEDSAAVFEATANGYLRKEVREHNGEKLKFISFSL